MAGGVVALPSIARRLAAVAFADVAGWSRLVQVDELAALRGWSALRTDLVEPKIKQYGGRLVDLAGDGVFAEFGSAVDAVSWALDVQRDNSGNAARPSAASMRLRIGVHVGDVLVDGERLVGDDVNIAARIQQQAAPGEIVVTEAVREHVQQRIAVSFRDLGERQLKNISRPIRLFRADAVIAAPAYDLMGTQAPMRALLALEVPPDARRTESEASWSAMQDYLAHEVVPARGGRVVGRYAGGLLMDFPKARPAVTAAFAIQQAFGSGQLGRAAGASLPRIGMQMREASADESDTYSGGAGLATRLTAIAEPGQIVVSSTVRDELIPGLDADIEDLGERYLSDMNQPVRACRLGPPVQLDLEGGTVSDELRPTIAVIPFTEHGEGHQSLGEIIAEEVIAALSRSADLNVVSRLSTTAFRGRGATPSEIGSHLRANYVLSGAYRISSNVLVLATELAEAKTGRALWARDLKGSVEGIVEGNDELIDRLVAEASGAVMARELERTQAQSLASLESCTLLIGAIALMHRLSLHDFNKARDMLLRVVQRAPRHAVPHAWLAKWHVLRVWQSWSDDVASDTRLALDHTKRALDNDSHCTLALAIDGFAHTNLLKALDVAQSRYDLALQLNPNDSLAWLLRGMLHAFKGEGKQAVKEANRALRLSPLDMHRYFYDSLAGGAEIAAGHYERAVELTQRSLRANRMHASTFRMLAIAQWQLGRRDEARATVAELMKIEPTLTASKWLEMSPSSDYPIGRLCADALRQAGVPA
jgi:class 3 adenylate cyclase/TolB-like protein